MDWQHSSDQWKFIEALTEGDASKLIPLLEKYSVSEITKGLPSHSSYWPDYIDLDIRDESKGGLDHLSLHQRLSMVANCIEVVIERMHTGEQIMFSSKKEHQSIEENPYFFIQKTAYIIRDWLGERKDSTTERILSRITKAIDQYDLKLDRRLNSSWFLPYSKTVNYLPACNLIRFCLNDPHAIHIIKRDIESDPQFGAKMFVEFLRYHKLYGPGSMNGTKLFFDDNWSREIFPQMVMLGAEFSGEIIVDYGLSKLAIDVESEMAENHNELYRIVQSTRCHRDLSASHQDHLVLT